MDRTNELCDDEIQHSMFKLSIGQIPKSPFMILVKT